MSAVTRNPNSLPVRPLVSEVAGNIADAADVADKELSVNAHNGQIVVKTNNKQVSVTNALRSTNKHATLKTFYEDSGEWKLAIDAARDYVGEGGVIEMPKGEAIKFERDFTLPDASVIKVPDPYIANVGNITYKGNNCSVAGGWAVFSFGNNYSEMTFADSETFGLNLHRGQGMSLNEIIIARNAGVGFLLGSGIHGQVTNVTGSSIVIEENYGGGFVASTEETGLVGFDTRPGVYPSLGSIVNAGSGYTDGVHSVNVTGGSGTDATAIVRVYGGAVVQFQIQCGGRNYDLSDVLSIDSPTVGAHSTIGAGTGFQWTPGTLQRLASQSPTAVRNWCNANKFTGMTVRDNKHLCFEGYGRISYNEFRGLQIEANDHDRATIYGEFALTKFMGGHIVGGNVYGATDQKLIQYVGQGRNNVHAKTRLAGLQHTKHFYDMLGLPENIAPGNTGATHVYDSCEINNVGITLSGWSYGGYLNNIPEDASVEPTQVLQGTIPRTPTAIDVNKKSVVYTLSDANAALLLNDNAGAPPPDCYELQIRGTGPDERPLMIGDYVEISQVIPGSRCVKIIAPAGDTIDGGTSEVVLPAVTGIVKLVYAPAINNWTLFSSIGGASTTSPTVTTFTPEFEFQTIGDLSVAYTTQIGEATFNPATGKTSLYMKMVCVPTFTTSGSFMKLTGLPTALVDAARRPDGWPLNVGRFEGVNFTGSMRGTQCAVAGSNTIIYELRDDLTRRATQAADITSGETITIELFGEMEVA